MDDQPLFDDVQGKLVPKGCDPPPLGLRLTVSPLITTVAVVQGQYAYLSEAMWTRVLHASQDGDSEALERVLKSIPAVDHGLWQYASHLDLDEPPGHAGSAESRGARIPPFSRH